jgi:hypothetical protein
MDPRAPREGPRVPERPSKQDFERVYDHFTQNTYKTFGQLMVKAWTDPAFAEQLQADPAGEMRKAGIPLPEDLEIAPEQFVMAEKPIGVSVENLRTSVGPGEETGEALTISCAGSISSFSCPSCTASCAGSGGC